MCLSVSGQADSPGLQENDAYLRGRGPGEVEEYCESFGQNRFRVEIWFFPEDSTDSASKVSSAGAWGNPEWRVGTDQGEARRRKSCDDIEKREGMLMH